MSCLEETIAHYIASLLTYTKAITDPFLKRMEADREQLVDFFEKSCAKERVRPSAPLQGTGFPSGSPTQACPADAWLCPSWRRKGI